MFNQRLWFPLQAEELHPQFDISFPQCAITSSAVDRHHRSRTGLRYVVPRHPYGRNDREVDIRRDRAAGHLPARRPAAIAAQPGIQSDRRR